MNELKPIPWKLSDIYQALDLAAQPDNDNGSVVFSGVSIDSRTIKSDELFVAIAGENFDAHGFAHGLLKKEIIGYVLENRFLETLSRDQLKDFKSNKALVFPVKNTLEALGKLARFQRLRSRAKVVAITGSNGKTSTREMTGEIFKTSFITLTTQGNFNNEIGLPLTLLKLAWDHQWAVVEMGMNHPGEIARLGAIAQPDIGVITNTTRAHLEGLGTVLNVAKAKSELMATITKGGSAVLNQDDPRFNIMAEAAGKNQNIDHLICFGLSDTAHVRADSISLSQEKMSFTLYNNQGFNVDVSINTPAPFMVSNALAASAAAFQAGISPQDIKKGIESFNPVSGRLNIITTPDNIHIIDDTYNANPGSVKGALETLKLLSAKNLSIAALGDMLELGESSEILHFGIGKSAALSGVSKLFAFGPMAEQVINGAISAGLDIQDTMIGTKPEIAEAILREAGPGSWVLIKGSRGMRMEEVLVLLKNFGNGNQHSCRGT